MVFEAGTGAGRCNLFYMSGRLVSYAYREWEYPVSYTHLEYYEPEELVGKTAIAIVNLPPRKMMGIDSEGMLLSLIHIDVYKRQGMCRD